MFGLPNTRYTAKTYKGDTDGTLSEIVVEAADANDLLVVWWIGLHWPLHTFNNTHIVVAYGTAPATFTDKILQVTLLAAGGVIDLPFKRGLYDTGFRGKDMRVLFDWDDAGDLSVGKPHAVIG